ncbi:MAG: hypothetical protein A3H93_19990 [Rhodocyclales bacterium RIFCSPLOWO2_02_FULL_63_24]|nr:MAG: hypothetical protein A2040_02985 [Rhodocyclales bacterium GWA2_65_19]OHC70213.1 MAG: hypothetical protein A3H93_19990 [Rhodocyclales bacterium RIFCSPLOWO2_02_FULL_63_24]
MITIGFNKQAVGMQYQISLIKPQCMPAQLQGEIVKAMLQVVENGELKPAEDRKESWERRQCRDESGSQYLLRKTIAFNIRRNIELS